MPDGGILTVSLDSEDDHWRICFQDTGTGISPQLIEKIFEPFSSGFEGGPGSGSPLFTASSRRTRRHHGQFAAGQRNVLLPCSSVRLKRTAARLMLPSLSSN